MQSILNRYNIDIIERNGILLVQSKLLELTNIRASIACFTQYEKCLLDIKEDEDIFKSINRIRIFINKICN